MNSSYRLGKAAGLNISARLSVIPAFLVLWLLLGVIAAGLLHLPPAAAIVGAFVSVLLHYASDLWHQIGHSWAARKTGYPMEGIVFWGWLSTSLYPTKEGDLPASIHIRRAIGGPLGSCLLTIAAGVLVLALQGWGIAGWVALFLFLDNLLILTIGSLIPLKFNDGGTLSYWLPKRN